MAAMTELERLGDALALMFVAFRMESDQHAAERMDFAEKQFRKVYSGNIGWAERTFKDQAKLVDEGKAEGRVPLDKRNPWR